MTSLPEVKWRQLLDENGEPIRAAPQFGEWHPIETAPLDGTPVILFARAKTATASSDVIGWFLDGDWVELCFYPNEPVGIVPSHWMPRPPFPSS